MRYHLTPLRMAINNKSKNHQCCRGCGEEVTLLHCCWDGKLVRPRWKTVWSFLEKLTMDLPFEPPSVFFLKPAQVPGSRSRCHQQKLALGLERSGAISPQLRLESTVYCDQRPHRESSSSLSPYPTPLPPNQQIRCHHPPISLGRS